MKNDPNAKRPTDWGYEYPGGYEDFTDEENDLADQMDAEADLEDEQREQEDFLGPESWNDQDYY